MIRLVTPRAAPMPIVNRTQLGEIFGYALTTVDVWIKDGCPCRGGGGKGVERKFDTAEVHQWLVKKAKAERAGRGNRFGGKTAELPAECTISIEEAKRRKEVANAKSAELALATEMGAVAPVDKLMKILSEEIANARARLLAIPTKLRPTMQLCASSPEKCKRAVKACADLIDEALNEIKVAGGGRPTS